MVDYTKNPPQPPSGGPINLTKGSPTVSLTKAGSVTGKMRINLNWDATGGQPVKKRWFGGNGSGIDLDLACLYELTSGDIGVVQALGESFGSFDHEPYIYLDGDDRTGTNVEGENLYVNLAHAHEFVRILIFAFIYDGAPSWDRAQGIVTLYPASGAPIGVRIDEHAGGKAVCAIALLENRGGDLTVSRQIIYTSSHRDLDDKYGWGLNWVAGSK